MLSALFKVHRVMFRGHAIRDDLWVDLGMTLECFRADVGMCWSDFGDDYGMVGG